MEEHRYKAFKSRWFISILICGQVFEKTLNDNDCEEVYKRIWISYSKTPLVKNESFCEEDRVSIAQGIVNVGDKILSHSQYGDKTLIQICSLQYSLCYFQQEAMPIAMMNWCSQVFDFGLKEINYVFDHKNNKYVFEI